MIRDNPVISIIIPVLNEENYIKKVLQRIAENSSTSRIIEILVIDGGSSDNTILEASKLGARVVSAKRGRATQMNLGATLATGDILYFLHVDTLPPEHFDRDILRAYADGFHVGCFRMRFDSNHPILRFFAWCTKINTQICRGGDQSLFITKQLFKKAGGFDEAYTIYEDNEFVRRIYKLAQFKILPNTVKTSARRYRKKGIMTLQCHFGMIHLKYYMGAQPEELYEYYRKYILV
ncbi:TIGR04283 family arsenosugar biosynthesis glycosyltransferase [Maribacter aestuarii]|uniref:TIGR04283 family arsenosugar biosynthesis glycosyltransferase n=1 Tax=Maribacter aestuarii TaxID=1130723 RepID=UPI00248CC7FA|nr:TIGR04283 family arsenosugar biosynthesis glycosyltransferase [Maribacter aestuarii]